MKTVEQNKSGPVYSPRRQSGACLQTMVEEICGKRELWTWNEIRNEWWRMRVVSRWKMN